LGGHPRSERPSHACAEWGRLSSIPIDDADRRKRAKYNPQFSQNVLLICSYDPTSVLLESFGCTSGRSFRADEQQLQGEATADDECEGFE